ELRVIAFRLHEAADLSREQRREADGRQVLEIWPDCLQPDRQPFTRTIDRERGRRLAPERGDGRGDDTTHGRRLLTIDRESQREVARVRREWALDVRVGERAERGCEQHVPVAEERSPRGAVPFTPAHPQEELAGRRLEPPRGCAREFAVVFPVP